MTDEQHHTDTNIQSIHSRESAVIINHSNLNLENIIRKINSNERFFEDNVLIEELIEFLVKFQEQDINIQNLIDHQLIQILRNFYVEFLKCWIDENHMDKQCCILFDTISDLFLKFSTQPELINGTIPANMIFDESLFYQINRWLKKIAKEERSLLDFPMRSIDNMVRTIQRLERRQLMDEKKQHLIEFYNNIVHCICSSVFIEIFHRFIRDVEENAGERFLLYTCTEYIYSHSIVEQRKEELLRIRQSLLKPFTNWLIEQSTYFRLWTNRMIMIVRQNCFLLTLSIQLNPNLFLDSDTLSDFSRLIDFFINILYSIIPTENCLNHKQAYLLLTTITPNLSTMISSKQLEKYLRDKHIVSLLMKMTDLSNDEIQLNGFRIIASLLTDYEMKNLVDAVHFVNNFQSFFRKLIVQTNPSLRLNHFLTCLKKIIQFDSMKDQFTKQNLVEMIVQCVSDKRFDSLIIYQTIFEILFSLTFNENAYRQIKENFNEFDRIIRLSSSLKWPALDYLLWKMDDQQIKSAKDKNNIHYDCMFLYSSEDKEVCNQIYDQLIKENYRICFRKDDNIQWTVSEKLEMIDQSNIILICISESFKFDSFCRCEALYVADTQSQWIPLIVTSNYRPDGWLTSFTQGQIYIDVVKADLEKSFKKLKCEIERRKTTIIIEPTEFSLERSISNSIHLLSSNLYHWTKEDVKTFSSMNNLVSLQPILSEINGSHLYELAQMCMANRESMFHTLNNELSRTNQNYQPLKLVEYLRFLNEIQIYFLSTTTIN